ncbi:hypothetical protein MAR_020799, partial [Mya arenaria]
MPSNRDPQRNTPRPIVAKFSFFKEREEVRRSGYMLKGTTFGIKEIEMKCRELYPLVRHFRAQKRHTVLVRDRLFVDGREVRAGEIDTSQDRRGDHGLPTGSGIRGCGGARYQHQ